MKGNSFTAGLLIAFSIFFSISHALEVMSWVPPYSVNSCYKTLNADYGAYSPKNVMNTLGLQFWRPTSSGGLVYEEDIDDDDVIQFREKCNEYGIRLLLCVYNNNQQDPGWDWSLARRAFDDSRTNFVNALVNECKRLKLDGVDIDLEGLGGHDEDRKAFALFINELGVKLHAEGLILTVDSFHSPCYNAPNMAWWGDWGDNVDHIHSMGYGTLYEANNKTLDGCPSDPDKEGDTFFKFSYHSQFTLDAGLAETVCSVGFPSSSSWDGKNASDHMRDILDLPSPVGFCIWDFTLGGSEWQQSSTWEVAKEIADIWPQTQVAVDKTDVQSKNLSIAILSNNQIKLTIEKEGRYSISLYDASGRLHRVLAEKHFRNGSHTLQLNTAASTNGIYILRVRGKGQSVSQKVVVNN